MTESYTGGPLNDITVTNTYDNLLRRSDCGVLNASSAILAATAYGYAAASRLLTVSDANGNTATYSYLANSPLVGQIGFVNPSQWIGTHEDDQTVRFSGPLDGH